MKKFIYCLLFAISALSAYGQDTAPPSPKTVGTVQMFYSISGGDTSYFLKSPLGWAKLLRYGQGLTYYTTNFKGLGTLINPLALSIGDSTATALNNFAVFKSETGNLVLPGIRYDQSSNTVTYNPIINANNGIKLTYAPAVTSGSHFLRLNPTTHYLEDDATAYMPMPTYDSSPTSSSNNLVNSGVVYTALASKQGVLTFDSSPTSSSSNPVTSGGVYTALLAKQALLTFDSSPTSASTNPVTSGGVFTALAGKQATLGFTPYNSTNPNNYIARTAISATSPIFYDSSTGIISAQFASLANNGIISSTNYATWNNKQSAITGTYVVPNGVTATTQTTGDNTAKLATDAFVNAEITAYTGFVPYSGATSNLNLGAFNISAAAGTFSKDISANGVSVGLGGGNIAGNINVGHIVTANTGQTGTGNVNVGTTAMEIVTTGSNNSNLGDLGMDFLQDGKFNTNVGEAGMYSLQSGSRNTGVGMMSGYNVSDAAADTAYDNTFVGYRAGFNMPVPNKNVIIGSTAGPQSGTTPHHMTGNVFIGYAAGQNETGNNKLYIANSNTSTPLIYGDFNTGALTINGSLNVTGGITGVTETDPTVPAYSKTLTAFSVIKGSTDALYQPIGNYMTGVTGDGTASGPGSAVFTLATVNGNVGSFGDASHTGTYTVNGKGLVIGASQNSIQIAEGQVTSLPSDLAAKQAALSGTGNVYSTAGTITYRTSIKNEVPSGTVNGSNTSFTVAHSPISGTIEIFYNGILLRPTTDYTISGTTVTMAFAPQNTSGSGSLLTSYNY